MKTNEINRRSFLKTGLTAATSLSLPTIIPSHSWARDNNTAPSNRITIGFIGVGNRGFGDLVRGFMGLSDCRVLAVCDVNRRFANKAKAYVDQTYGNTDCAVYGDFREILVRKDIDAVVIGTPDHWHAVMTVMACQHGKDVYCEKPLSRTIREAKVVVEAARRYARVVQVGSHARSSPIIRYACQVVRQGGIGEIKKIIAVCGVPPFFWNLPPEPVPDYFDWDMWVGPALWRPYNRDLVQLLNWRQNRDYSGGAMSDRGAHFYDVAHWGMGMDYSGPVEIIPSDGKDDRLVTLKYANGVEVIHPKIQNDWGLHDKYSIGTYFFGSEGTVYVHTWREIATFEPESLGKAYFQKLKAMNAIRNAEAVRNPQRDINSPTLTSNHLENFLDCVRNRKRPNADVDLARHSVIVPLLANIALYTNRNLRWNPDKEEFINDSDANRYLDKPRREPWTL